MGSRVMIVGAGNVWRGDDGVGPTVAAAVAERAGPDVAVVATADPSRLIDLWGDSDTVVVIDALVSDSQPGSVGVFDAGEAALPAEAATFSSHGLGVAEAIELARSVDRLPARLVVVGVAGREFEGWGLSEEVESAVEEAARVVMEVVEDA